MTTAYEFTFEEMIRALDVLDHAESYLAEKSSSRLPRGEARATLDARTILVIRGWSLLQESEWCFFKEANPACYAGSETIQ